MTNARLTIVFATAVLTAPASSAGQEMPPLPKPGPEHQVLKLDEGTWEATTEMFPAPGAPPMTSKGVETNTIGCGGLCLIADFKGEIMPGVAFHGHGTTAYDTIKNKYVASWTDSLSAGLSTGESTWDAAARQMTGWVEGTDMTGKNVKSRSVLEHKDANTRVYTMYGAGPDGKEFLNLRITYTRRP